MVKATPAMKAPMEQAWRNIEGMLKGPAAASAKAACDAALKGYAGAPNAPAECK